LSNERSEATDPKVNSLWLLPSGPDQVGEAFARPPHGLYAYFHKRVQEGIASTCPLPHPRRKG